MESLRAAIERFDPRVPIERAWTPPSVWYVDPRMADVERQAVFQRSWQPVARVAQLQEVGSYRSGCLAGEPWLVIRGEDGVLRAFHNVCLHKGRELLTGAGTARELVCGYHAWRYASDGRLRSAPGIAGIEDFDRRALSLAPMRLECWGPWVFICGDPEAEGLAGSIPELDAALQASGWHTLRFVARKSWEVACNWKVVVDNYLDGGYHVPHMHPSLAAQIDMRSYRTECYSRSSIQTAQGRKDAGDGLDFDPEERVGAGAIYGWIYPNFMVNRYGRCLDANHVIPLDHQRCRVEYEFYFEPGAADEGFAAASIEQADVTQREDIEICESVQRGLGSSAYDRGRYAPRVEQGEHHFHRLLAQALRALDSSVPPSPS